MRHPGCSPSRRAFFSGARGGGTRCCRPAAAAGDPHPSGRFTLEEYLERAHVSVTTAENRQTMIDRPLGDRGRERRVVVRSPYFLATMGMVAGTDLVFTAPRRLVDKMIAPETAPSLRRIAPPPEIAAFPYPMVCHPRLDADAAQAWFRGLVRDAARPGPP